MNSYRTLPPLSTLIGFEAAARLHSFSRAAKELNITQSAISHQIRTLEDHLGQPLFRRIGRRIELIDAGVDFLTTAQTALEAVRQGVRRLNAFSKPGSVIVMMSPALAMGWFIPRLPRLRQELPWLDPWLHTTPEIFVPEDAEIDIVLGPRLWPEGDAVSIELARDPLVVLCAPAYAATLPDLPDARRLDHAALLHDETQHDWQKWFVQVGSTRQDFTKGSNFSDTAMMLQVALSGQGCCIASARLADSFLTDGRLVQAASQPLLLNEALFLSAWRRNFARPAVEALWHWLTKECQIPVHSDIAPQMINP